MRKSYTVEDYIKESSIANFFYNLYCTEKPAKASPLSVWVNYFIKTRAGRVYLGSLILKNKYILLSTRFFPFSKMFRGDISHYQFKEERKIIEEFEYLASKNGLFISIKGFDKDAEYVYYVGFFQFQSDLEKNLEKLQKIIQKYNNNFYVRKYENGWFKIMMPWKIYLMLRKKYEKK